MKTDKEVFFTVELTVRFSCLVPKLSERSPMNALSGEQPESPYL